VPALSSSSGLFAPNDPSSQEALFSKLLKPSVPVGCGRSRVSEALSLLRTWTKKVAGLSPRFGVTAIDVDDALGLIGRLDPAPLPSVARVVEDIDVSTLDAGHVLPNTGPPNRRRVWFPNLTGGS
jgi:hypothetical protein